LFAGKEWMAIRADFYVDVALVSRASGKAVAACAHNAHFVISGMDGCFHVCFGPQCESLDSKGGARDSANSREASVVENHSAFICETEKVPKPISATRSPFFSAEVMLSTVVSMAPAACVLLMWQPAAILSMRSALFIVAPVRASLSQGGVNEQFCCVETPRSYLATGLVEC